MNQESDKAALSCSRPRLQGTFGIYWFIALIFWFWSLVLINFFFCFLSGATSETNLDCNTTSSPGVLFSFALFFFLKLLQTFFLTLISSFPYFYLMRGLLKTLTLFTHTTQEGVSGVTLSEDSSSNSASSSPSSTPDLANWWVFTWALSLFDIIWKQPSPSWSWYKKNTMAFVCSCMTMFRCLLTFPLCSSLWSLDLLPPAWRAVSHLICEFKNDVSGFVSRFTEGTRLGYAAAADWKQCKSAKWLFFALLSFLFTFFLYALVLFLGLMLPKCLLYTLYHMWSKQN